MWNIERRTKFKKDYKKIVRSGVHIDDLEFILIEICSRRTLPQKFNDHILAGNWKGRRECHVKPDVLLIYKVDDTRQLIILERIGSHAELFE